MRVVLRVLFFEFALSWTMVIAGCARVAVQVWPHVKDPLKAGFRSRALREGLGILVGLVVIAGWPALLSLIHTGTGAGDWLDVAEPWWAIAGPVCCLMIAAKICEERSRRAAVPAAGHGRDDGAYLG
jgi:hypothetical protein